MKILHHIKIEFEETIDDSKIGKGSPEEIAAAAHNYSEQLEEFCKKIETDGLKKVTEVYSLKKAFCLCDMLRDLADYIENGECKCCKEDKEENTEEEKCE